MVDITELDKPLEGNVKYSASANKEFVEMFLEPLYKVTTFVDVLNSMSIAQSNVIAKILRNIITQKNKYKKAFFNNLITFVKDYHDVLVINELIKFLQEIHDFNDSQELYNFRFFLDGYKGLMAGNKELYINCFKLFDAYRYTINFLRTIKINTNDDDILNKYKGDSKNVEYVWLEIFITKLFDCLKSVPIDYDTLINPFYYVRYHLTRNLSAYMEFNNSTYEVIFGRRKSTAALEDKLIKLDRYLNIINNFVKQYNHEHCLLYKEDLDLEARCALLAKLDDDESLLVLFRNQLGVDDVKQIYPHILRLKEDIQEYLINE